MSESKKVIVVEKPETKKVTFELFKSGKTTLDSSFFPASSRALKSYIYEGLDFFCK